MLRAMRFVRRRGSGLSALLNTIASITVKDRGRGLYHEEHWGTLPYVIVREVGAGGKELGPAYGFYLTEKGLVTVYEDNTLREEWFEEGDDPEELLRKELTEVLRRYRRILPGDYDLVIEYLGTGGLKDPIEQMVKDLVAKIGSKAEVRFE